MSATTYGYTEARGSLKHILDSSARGGVSIIRRAHDTAAVVNGENLRVHLQRTIGSEPVVVNEDGAWAVFMRGLPLAAEAATLDEAVADFVGALREYAEDWEDHLSAAPNHRDNWALVQLIGLSSDEQLTAWLEGE
jgi:hypothetical protein